MDVVGNVPAIIYIPVRMAGLVIVPVAMTVVLTRAVRVVTPERFRFGVNLLAASLGLLVVGIQTGIVGGQLVIALSGSLGLRFAWAVPLLPGAIVYLISYCAVLWVYRRSGLVASWRPTAVVIGVAVLALAAVGTYAIDVPGAAGKALTRYFATRSEVASYRAESVRWTYRCCMEWKQTEPLQANYVRYHTLVMFKDGRSEIETVDLSDSRDEATQIDDASGGHQEWVFVQTFRPGEVVPQDTW
jgi:hypothetical protein